MFAGSGLKGMTSSYSSAGSPRLLAGAGFGANGGVVVRAALISPLNSSKSTCS